MWFRLGLRVLGSLLLLGGLFALGYFTRSWWWPLIGPKAMGEAGEHTEESEPAGDRVILTDAAIAGFRLESEPAQLTAFWRTIQVPGMVLDRPGRSDRGVVAPITSSVAMVHRLPGETVTPGMPLFTLTVLNDPIQTTQADLLRTTQDLKLAETQRQRIAGSGSLLPAGRLIEADNQVTRLQVAVQTLRSELRTRGLTSEQIEAAARGTFVREMTVTVPPRSGDPRGNVTYEVQDLKVELGQKVEAGQTLCVLADHQALAIEGRAFRDELARIEWAAKQNWPIAVELGEGFAGDREAIHLLVGCLGQASNGVTALADLGRLSAAVAEGSFPPPQRFVISQIGNTVDPTTRTVGFLVPLVNQGRVIQQGDRTATLWRYRPGQAARLYVPVERLDGVFVLPADAVTRRGAETFLFTQNTNTFSRVPVRVLAQERGLVVLANDGGLSPGAYVVQGSAGHLARMLDTQGAGVPKGYHMHADGSLHKNGDPEP